MNMRPIIVAAAALSLAACGNNDQTDNNANVDENLSAESIVSNDVTAIDAVTGDAANMAADVDINFTADQVLSNGGNTIATKRPSRPSTSRPSASRPSPTSNSLTPTPPAAQPASNTTANAI